ncbi:hypothetical protein AAVH_38550 [Aphelenchoides avenae]|nr:hypothetical protein AAVH_38550 [Aphelenchus avenae]
MLDVIPISVCSVAITSGMEQFHFMLLLLTSCLAWIPVANPLSAILFIKCYRTAVRKFIGKLACSFVVRLGWKSPRTYDTSHYAVSPMPSTNRT